MYRGRGRDYKSQSRGRDFRRPTPYMGRTPEDPTLPAPTPDHLLVHDRNSLGHHTAKTKDDIRVAKDWKSYYERYFERERYTIPRPAETHPAPDYATLHEKLAAVFNNTKETVKTTVAEHLQEVITKAE